MLLVILILIFQQGIGENGTGFGTLFTMADENIKELNSYKSLDNKDVEFFTVEAEQESSK